ncbi:MAG: hypothetical protein WAV32_06540 [Halobacteriota archaeon]
MVNEEQLVEQLAQRIEERIRYKIVKSIIDALEEQFYPPEEMFREEFVKSVEEAEKESGRIFKDREELKEYLESLAEEDV